LSSVKNIAVISVARSDFGRLLPSLKLIDSEPRYNLQLLVTGNHCHEKYGSSINEIKENGFTPEKILDPGTGSACKKAASIFEQCGEWFAENKPDYFIILGDRYEMLAAAQAAVMEHVSIIHIGGGYQTVGAIDDKIRHAITAMSEYHIVASEKCRDRVLSASVQRKNVHLFGAPDLEILHQIEKVDRQAFCEDVGLDFNKKFSLVTFHPETGVNFEENGVYMKSTAKFLCALEDQILITSPCADPGAYCVFNLINEVKKKKPDTVFVESLGINRYVNAMRHAVCMIGNSSSGIIESATMYLPVVNVGKRQEGREQSGNVINSSFEGKDLMSAYKVAVSKTFQARCDTLGNVYGDGKFSGRFIKFLKKNCW
jgi:UDP-hydrolysing UDP-N-acetyl-D-glucosamine 2-epimerase